MRHNRELGVVTSLDEAINLMQFDGPLPSIAIREPNKFNVLNLFGTDELDERPVDSSAAMKREISALARSVRGETAQPSLLESIIMEDAQTIGSIAASCGLEVEAVGVAVQDLQDEGWITLAISDSAERVHLNL